MRRRQPVSPARRRVAAVSPARPSKDLGAGANTGHAGPGIGTQQIGPFGAGQAHYLAPGLGQRLAGLASDAPALAIIRVVLIVGLALYAGLFAMEGNRAEPGGTASIGV